ncbi:hypothetical protein ABEW81_11195 [Priestia megaterium]
MMNIKSFPMADVQTVIEEHQRVTDIQKSFEEFSKLYVVEADVKIIKGEWE